MPLVTLQLQDTVAIVRIDRPPVNAIDATLRAELDQVLGEALGDPAVRAVVITGTTRAFSAGADIEEFTAGPAERKPDLRSIIVRIEDAPKPVIAAIDGVCMGGGLELALGCHYRLATASARFALPEVKLGRVPGAGGTQRLPRAIGLVAAIPLVLTGETVTAERAATLGIVTLVAGDLLAEACALARRAADRGERPRLRDAAVSVEGSAGAHELIEATRARLRPPLPASLAVLECLEAAATLPFDEGLGFEWRSFECVLDTPESRALRYVFFSERAAARIPSLPAGTAPRPVARLAVIGAGTMGGGIAMCAANAGIPVTLIDQTLSALDKGLGTIRRNYEATVRKGRLDAAEAERRIALITPATETARAADADLIIEAVFEDLGVKEQVFRILDAVAKPGAILASNTSTLDVNHIASFTRRPADVIGLHFFSPANVMRLLEIVRSDRSAPDVIATALAFARRITKVGVVAGVCDGFIGNRLFEEYLRQAYFMLDEGATPEQVDRAMETFGMAMGPFAVMDLAGNDIGWAIRRRRAVEQPDRPYSHIPDLLCERGRFGQKTGAGFYRYDPVTRRRETDPEVEALIVEYRQSLGIEPRPVADEEIVSRCLLALANEGARVLQEGIAYRASDIDVVYVNGYGFPAYRGGPMWQADERGLAAVLHGMEVLRGGYHGECWEPAPRLLELAARGERLTGA